MVVVACNLGMDRTVLPNICLMSTQILVYHTGFLCLLYIQYYKLDDGKPHEEEKY